MLLTYSESLKNSESSGTCSKFIRPFPDLVNLDFSSKKCQLTRRLVKKKKITYNKEFNFVIIQIVVLHISDFFKQITLAGK